MSWLENGPESMLCDAFQHANSIRQVITINALFLFNLYKKQKQQQQTMIKSNKNK